MTDPALTVRRTVEADWPEVRALRLEMLADTPLAYLETLAQAERRSEAEWRAWARGGSSAESITVAGILLDGPARGGTAHDGTTSDGTVRDGTASEGRWVATMMSKVPPGASGAFLYGVYVAPSHRGKTAGVTDALLTRVEEWARERGDTLTLEVHELNGRARAAYRERGFVETGVTLPYPLDRTQRELQMQKRLR